MVHMGLQDTQTHTKYIQNAAYTFSNIQANLNNNFLTLIVFNKIHKSLTKH